MIPTSVLPATQETVGLPDIARPTNAIGYEAFAGGVRDTLVGREDDGAVLPIVKSLQVIRK